MRCHHIPTSIILAHFWAEISQDGKMVTWGILVYTRVENSDSQRWSLSSLLRLCKGVWNTFAAIRCLHIHTAVILAHFRAKISKDGKMVTWGSIMVHIHLGSSYWVNAGPWHLTMVWKEVWNTFAAMRVHHIPTVVILPHFWAEISQDSKRVTWGGTWWLHIPL